MDKVYKIQNNGLTVLLKNPDGEGKFKFEGLIINNNPNVVYMSYVDMWTKKEEGKTYVSLYNYLYDKLKVEADKQLKEYINNNINNKDFYTKKDEYNHFFRDNLFADGELPNIKKEIKIYLDGIAEGVVNCIIGGYISCKYDIIQDKFIEIKEHYNSKRITPLDVFYGCYLDYILAIEQYNRGIAHKAFTEIVNLNKFLKGKKSIKIALKDGRVLELKKDNIKASDILSITNDEFVLNHNYYFRPMIDEELPLTEVDYLQYSKTIYKINTDNLIIK